MSDAMRPLGKNEPLMIAWERFKQTEEFRDARQWARVQFGEALDGTLWGVFMAGFVAATELAAAHHESVNPASDRERSDGHPGAGAMGAVIEYRDLIRKGLP